MVRERNQSLLRDKIYIEVCCSEGVDFHSHDFLEIAYVTKGPILHVMNTEKETLSEGDYFLMDYGAVHKYQRAGPDGISVINCLFYPAFLDSTLAHCRSFQEMADNYLIGFRGGRSRRVANRIYHDRDGTILSVLRRLDREYEQKETGYLEIMRAGLVEFIVRMMRCSGESTDDKRLERTTSYQMMRYADEHFMNPSLLKEICCHMNFSMSYLSRRFYEETGTHFMEYLQKVRMEQSCRLLANTEKKIIEIAQLCGYSDIKFFNQIFRRHMNITPREYRKLTKGMN